MSTNYSVTAFDAGFRRISTSALTGSLETKRTDYICSSTCRTSHSPQDSGAASVIVEDIQVHRLSFNICRSWPINSIVSVQP